MEHFSWDKIIVILVGGSGAVTLIINALTFIFNRIQKRREDKLEELGQHLSTSTEFEQLRLEGMKFASSEFQILILSLKKDVKELKLEIADCEKHREDDRRQITALQNRVGELERDVGRK